MSVIDSQISATATAFKSLSHSHSLHLDLTLSSLLFLVGIHDSNLLNLLTISFISFLLLLNRSLQLQFRNTERIRIDRRGQGNGTCYWKEKLAVEVARKVAQDRWWWRWLCNIHLELIQPPNCIMRVGPTEQCCLHFRHDFSNGHKAKGNFIRKINGSNLKWVLLTEWCL